MKTTNPKQRCPALQQVDKLMSVKWHRASKLLLILLQLITMISNMQTITVQLVKFFKFFTFL